MPSDDATIMDLPRNKDGFVLRHRDQADQPPCGPRWLEAHHLAKLAERRRFAERLANLKPRSVLDLGCGPGLWLDLLHGFLPADCSFIGVDTDEGLLEIARDRSRGWPQSARFEVLDLEADADRLPVADLTMMFNVMLYLTRPLDLLETIATRNDGSAVAVREGTSLRFGPLPPEQCVAIEQELLRSIAQHPPFRLYDLDRTYAALTDASFAHREIEFELFERTAPFPPELERYWDGTLWWTANNVSPTTAAWLERWRAGRQPVGEAPAYIVEVDVVAVLRSAG
jgi:SAM-dependent methyltransferase